MHMAADASSVCKIKSFEVANEGNGIQSKFGNYMYTARRDWV